MVLMRFILNLEQLILVLTLCGFAASNYYNTLLSERFISWPQQPVLPQKQQQCTLRREVQHRQTIRLQQQHCQTNYSTLPAVRTTQQSPVQQQQGHQADVRVPPLHGDNAVTIRRMTFHRNVGQNVRSLSCRIPAFPFSLQRYGNFDLKFTKSCL